MNRDIRKDTAEFFDEFVEAFKTFDGSVIAQRYFSPYTAVQTDGTHNCLETSSDIANYFQRYLDNYHSIGCRSCGYKMLDIVPIGPCVLATVTWELYDGNGSIVSSWRESYSLAYEKEKMLVLASIDHAA